MLVTISLFDNARTNRAVRETLSFENFLTDFKTPVVSDLEPTPESAKALKMSCSAFAPAVFKEDRRKKANIEQAQVLAFDIDEAVNGHELAERLRRRGISWAVHSTTSGRGVHVLIPLARPVDHETYLRYWDEARSIFYGIEIDESKRGAESLFFAPKIFSAHQKAYFFDCVTDAPYLGASGFAPFRPEKVGADKYVDEVRRARNKHTTVNRNAFVLGLLGVELEDAKTRLLGALRENVTSDAVVSWDAAEHTIVSAWTDGHAQKEAEDARPKFVPKEAQSTGKRVLKEALAGIKKGEPLGAWGFKVGQFVPHVLEYESVLDLLKEAWEGAKNHDTRSLDTAVSELVSGLDAGKRTPVGVHEDWQRELKLTPDGLGFHAGENNVYIVLEKHPDLQGLAAHDVREGAPMYLREPPWHKGLELGYPRRLEDSDRQPLACWLREQLGVANVKPRTALEGLADLANRSKHDALLEYFKNCVKATSTNVIETVLCRVLGAEDSAYTRAVTMKWFIGLVARQFQPGCKMDNLLILVGEQGLGKSTFLQELFPPELQEAAYTDSLNMLRLERDQIVKLSRYACVEIGELAAMNKSDIETVKMAISQRVGDERAAYAQLHARYPRRAVFVGTTNRGDFLRDPTGARRFWPVEVKGRLDLEALRAIRSDLWGEAVGAYHRGVSWHLGAAEEALAGEVREDYQEEDTLLEEVRALLAEWPGESKFENPNYHMQAWQLDGKRVLKVRLGQLLLKLGYDLGDKQKERRVADVLRRFGWTCKLEKHAGTPYRIWYNQAR
jgi:predicted P-loop ATPase